jgi:hypothetical protein
MLAQYPDIPVFTITNNVVHDLATFADAEKKQKTLEGVTKFLVSNRWCAGATHVFFSNVISLEVNFIKETESSKLSSPSSYPPLCFQFCVSSHSPWLYGGQLSEC